MSIKLYLINQQRGTIDDVPNTPFFAETTYHQIENYHTQACNDCYALSNAEAPLCVVAESLRLRLLEDPALDKGFEYFILDTTVYPDALGYNCIEHAFNEAGAQLMHFFQYPLSRGDRNAKEVHRHLTNIVGAMQSHRFTDGIRRRSIDEVVNSVEFKAMRAMLYSLMDAGAEVSTYDMCVPVKPRPFLERLVLKPLVQLVDELIDIPSKYCASRNTRPF